MATTGVHHTSPFRGVQSSALFLFSLRARINRGWILDLVHIASNRRIAIKRDTNTKLETIICYPVQIFLISFPRYAYINVVSSNGIEERSTLLYEIFAEK